MPISKAIISLNYIDNLFIHNLIITNKTMSIRKSAIIVI